MRVHPLILTPIHFYFIRHGDFMMASPVWGNHQQRGSGLSRDRTAEVGEIEETGYKAGWDQGDTL